MRRATILLLTAALATGCEDFQLDDVMPTVRFERMDVDYIDFQRIDSQFVFAIDNPNPISVSLADFSYDLDLEGVDFIDGDDPDGFTLESMDATDYEFPLSTTWQGLWDTVQATRGEDYIDFGLSGRFGFDTPLGHAPVPYSTDGDFPALRTPKFSFQKIRVSNVDVFTQMATIEVDLGVNNSHASTVFFDAFDYTLSLNGIDVAGDRIDQLGGVEGATDGTLSLPVTIDLLSAGTEVASAIINKTPLDAGIVADMDVDTPFGIAPLSIDESGRVKVR